MVTVKIRGGSLSLCLMQHHQVLLMHMDVVYIAVKNVGKPMLMLVHFGTTANLNVAKQPNFVVLCVIMSQRGKEI